HGSCLGGMLTLTPDDLDEGLTETFDDIPCRPKGIIPFAETGHGDYMCFDYNHRNPDGSPTVVYWENGIDTDLCFIHLSDTFSGFLDLLTESPISDSDLDRLAQG